mmetsp:Transcript_30408/g.47631  ORF Transcript_30408/g.47631 Transcript_30408/m.47631 type:complete len:244 (-) Transcript_30408:142-873(-)
MTGSASPIFLPALASPSVGAWTRSSVLLGILSLTFTLPLPPSVPQALAARKAIDTQFLESMESLKAKPSEIAVINWEAAQQMITNSSGSSAPKFEAGEPADAVSRTTTSFSWTDCGPPGKTIRFEAALVSPVPLRPGEVLTIQINGTSSDPFLNPKIRFSQFYHVQGPGGKGFWFEFFHGTFDLCHIYPNKCPLSKGEFHWIDKHQPPGGPFIPNGMFRSKQEYLGSDGNVKGCIQLDMPWHR